MSGKILVSIIVPLYNKVAYIKDAINSVLKQTVVNWELLIVNNGSEDGGDVIVNSFQDSRIKLLNLAIRTGGPGAPRNVGLDHATGTWILFLDADDTIAPNHLETLLATAKDNPTAAIIAGCWQEYSEETPDDRVVVKPTGYDQGIAGVPETSIAYAPWAVHAALVKREILVTPYCWVEGLDPYLSEDTAFWFRLLTKYSFCYSPNQGASYRKCQDSRNQYHYPAKWLHGIQAITASNVRFLEQQNLPLTAKHCESLMRLYSSIYLMAKEQQNETTAITALSMAQHWLQECVSLGGCNTLPLKARRMLGLQRFLPLMSVQHSVREVVGRASR